MAGGPEDLLTAPLARRACRPPGVSALCWTASASAPTAAGCQQSRPKWRCGRGGAACASPSPWDTQRWQHKLCQIWTFWPWKPKMLLLFQATDTDLVLLQELKFNGDVWAEPFVLLLLYLVQLLSSIYAGHSCGVPRAHTQLFQVWPICIKLQSAHKRDTTQWSFMIKFTLVSDIT